MSTVGRTFGVGALMVAAIGGAVIFPTTTATASTVVAEAGGPYKVKEGSTVTLAGSGTSDAGGALSYSWTPAGRFDDPSSATPHVVGLDNGIEYVTLSVSDEVGGSDTDDARITTTNVKPAIRGVLAEATPANGLWLELTAIDPGILDTHTATVNWGDGSSGPASVGQGAGTATIYASHDYASGGRYTISVTVTDDDGGAASWTQALIVGCSIVGTPGDDAITGTPGDDVICSLAGNDTIHAGAGNDTVWAGDGDDSLYGEAGIDNLIGGAGTDMTSGGADPDGCWAAEIRLNCRLSWWIVPQ